MSEPQANYTDNLVTLRKDAARVVHDLSDLTDKLTESGKDLSKEVAADVVQQIEKQIQSLSMQVKILSEDIKQGTKQVDTHVKAHPYAYILGAVGMGFLLGKIRTSSKNSP